MIKNYRVASSLYIYLVLLFTTSCSDDSVRKTTTPENSEFYFGADLSFVNQILDHNGVYKENGEVTDPYVILKNNGTNLVRLRLWHSPMWTKEVYGTDGVRMYNDIIDVERAAASAKALGMQVLLDFHYSDTWADPGKQYIPQAWKSIRDINVLRDSVYNYTFKTLQYLKDRALLPEFVQLGNETNCGMLFSEASQAFPSCNVCNGEWSNMGAVVNAGIKAVHDIAGSAGMKTKILLHVADPNNVDWWFENMKSQAKVTDFDMIGFSYYPLWHTTVTLDDISAKISEFKSKFGKDVMILETAYPWSASGADDYSNQFGGQMPLDGLPFSEEGQYNFMKKLTQEVINGGGNGVIYWEPAWITSGMKDGWGTGSSWENCTFFNFSGEELKVVDYMTVTYK